VIIVSAVVNHKVYAEFSSLFHTAGTMFQLLELFSLMLAVIHCRGLDSLEKYKNVKIQINKETVQAYSKHAYDFWQFSFFCHHI